MNVRTLAAILAVTASISVFGARVAGEEVPEKPDNADGIHCSFCSGEVNDRFWVYLPDRAAIFILD